MAHLLNFSNRLCTFARVSSSILPSILSMHSAIFSLTAFPYESYPPCDCMRYSPDTDFSAYLVSAAALAAAPLTSVFVELDGDKSLSRRK